MAEQEVKQTARTTVLALTYWLFGPWGQRWFFCCFQLEWFHSLLFKMSLRTTASSPVGYNAVLLCSFWEGGVHGRCQSLLNTTGERKALPKPMLAAVSNISPVATEAE